MLFRSEPVAGDAGAVEKEGGEAGGPRPLVVLRRGVADVERLVRRELRRLRPDLVHLHNTAHATLAPVTAAWAAGVLAAAAMVVIALWLAPEQVRVLPLTEKQLDFARDVVLGAGAFQGSGAQAFGQKPRLGRFARAVDALEREEAARHQLSAGAAGPSM